MTKTIEEVRAALVRSNEGLGRPYPESARRAVLAHVERRRHEGVALSRVAEELGMSATTLRKWKQQEQAPLAATTPFREVEIITAHATATGLVVHGPYGLRIEGATIADIAELVRRLA